MKLLNKLENGKALIYAHNKLKEDKDFVKLLFGDLEIVSLEELEMVEGIFEYVDEDLLEEKDLVLYILQKLHDAVGSLVNSLDKEDEEMTDDVLDIYEDFFEDLDDDLRADKEVVLKMFAICDDFKKALTKESGFSDDIVEECIDFIEDCLEEVDEDLLDNEDFMNELTSLYPYLSEFEIEDDEDEDEKEEEDDEAKSKEIEVKECSCGEHKECTCGGECKCEEKEVTVVENEEIKEEIVKEEVISPNVEEKVNEEV